jgi:hypothetical protein
LWQARAHEQLDRSSRGGLGRLHELHHRCDGHDWVARQELEETQHNDRRPLVREHACAIYGHERKQVPCRDNPFQSPRRQRVVSVKALLNRKRQASRIRELRACVGERVDGVAHFFDL